MVSHEYPPVGGGGGKVALDLSQAFAGSGHEIRVITAHYGDLALQENQDGVLIKRLRSLRSQPFRAGMLAMAGFVVAGIFATLREIRHWNPHVIHVHFAVPAGPIAWLVNRITGTPYVLTVHLGDVPGGTPEKTDKWFKWIFPFTPPIWRKAARVIAVSEFTRQLALQNYDLPVQVIPNGVPLEGLRPEQIVVNQTPRLVFAGRFMPQKDPLMVIKALAACADLDWHCTMAGDGPLMSQIQQAIRYAGLESRFTLTGWVHPERVREIFLESDILIMPSLSEGLPVVGVQALSAGLAFAVSHIGGFVDLVKDGLNGFLIAPQNESAWQEKLRQLLSSAQLIRAFRIESLEIAKNFDLERITQAYLQVFDDVVQNNTEKQHGKV